MQDGIRCSQRRGQTAEEEDGEDAIALTECQSAESSQSEDDVEWARMEYVRCNRLPLDHLDGWSSDELKTLDDELRDAAERNRRMAAERRVLDMGKAPPLAAPPNKAPPPPFPPASMPNPVWDSGQTVEEEGGEDAAAMTEGLSGCCGPSEDDVEWERMELVRANRELLGNLDGWSCGALEYLYNFLRYDMGPPLHFNVRDMRPHFKAPPLLPPNKAPPPPRPAQPPPIPTPKNMPTMPRATPKQMAEPEPNGRITAVEPSDLNYATVGVSYAVCSRCNAFRPVGLQGFCPRLYDVECTFDESDGGNVMDSLWCQADECPLCGRYDRCPCNEEEASIARYERGMYTGEVETCLRIEMELNPEWEQMVWRRFRIRKFGGV